MCAAPSHIPFGSKITIPGVGTYTVQDRGGGVHMLRNGVIRVDIFFTSHRAALRFGRRTVTQCTVEI